MSRGSHETATGHTRSHGTPTSRGSRKLSTVSPKRSREKTDTTRTRVAEITVKTYLTVKTDRAAKTGPATMTGPTAKIDTIVKTATRNAEEKRGDEGEKHRFAISMARTKVIGPMNAQSQLKRRQSLNAKMHTQQN